MYKEYISQERLIDFRLFLTLIRADLTPDRIKRVSGLVESGAVDWAFIFLLAQKHRVLPVLYANIKKAGLLPVLPEAVHKEMFRWYWNIIGNSLRLSNKLMAVLALFESRHIPAVPFKGPLLAHILYGDSALRYYLDLDILVPGSCVYPAREALLASGYLPAFPQLAGKQFTQLLKYARECNFQDPSDRVAIDLHWQLSVPYRQAFDYDFCKERLRVIRFHGQDISSLSAEDTLLHLCVNGAHDTWDCLEKILCVAEWIDRHSQLDWQLVQKLSGLLYCRRRLLLGLFLARDVFGTILPEEMADQIQKDKTVQAIAETAYADLFQDKSGERNMHERVAKLPYYLKVREHPGDKFLYLLRRIFIPTQKDWKKRSLNPRWAGFYFLTRPIDLAVELVRALPRIFQEFFRRG